MNIRSLVDDVKVIIITELDTCPFVFVFYVQNNGLYMCKLSG